MMNQLELACSTMRSSGVSEQWFKGADSPIRAVTKEANGALSAALLQASNYVDAECAELLRTGFHSC